MSTHRQRPSLRRRQRSISKTGPPRPRLTTSNLSSFLNLSDSPSPISPSPIITSPVLTSPSSFLPFTPTTAIFAAPVPSQADPFDLSALLSHFYIPPTDDDSRWMAKTRMTMFPASPDAIDPVIPLDDPILTAAAAAPGGATGERKETTAPPRPPRPQRPPRPPMPLPLLDAHPTLPLATRRAAGTAAPSARSTTRLPIGPGASAPPSNASHAPAAAPYPQIVGLPASPAASLPKRRRVIPPMPTSPPPTPPTALLLQQQQPVAAAVVASSSALGFTPATNSLIMARSSSPRPMSIESFFAAAPIASGSDMSGNGSGNGGNGSTSAPVLPATAGPAHSVGLPTPPFAAITTPGSSPRRPQLSLATRASPSPSRSPRGSKALPPLPPALTTTPATPSHSPLPSPSRSSAPSTPPLRLMPRPRRRLSRAYPRLSSELSDEDDEDIPTPTTAQLASFVAALPPFPMPPPLNMTRQAVRI